MCAESNGHGGDGNAQSAVNDHTGRTTWEGITRRGQRPGRRPSGGNGRDGSHPRWGTPMTRISIRRRLAIRLAAASLTYLATR